MIIQLQIEDSQSQFFIDLISKLKGVVEDINIIEHENRDCFEIEDKNGLLHKISNWTEYEFRKFELRNFFENDDVVSLEELFNV